MSDKHMPIDNPSYNPVEAPVNAFLDGVDAALRTGRYAGYTDIPECQFAEGTPDFVEWHNGFDFGFEQLTSGDIFDGDVEDVG